MHERLREAGIHASPFEEVTETLKLEPRPHEILQVICITPFEKVSGSPFSDRLMR
jgi:hypothetical protein